MIKMTETVLSLIESVNDINRVGGCSGRLLNVGRCFQDHRKFLKIEILS